jgi:hypothetical protein
MAKYFVAGTAAEVCTLKIIDNTNGDYIGYYNVSSPGAYELVFEKSTIGKVDIMAENSIGKSVSYGDVTPLDGGSKVINISFPFTVIRGGNASSYGVAL